MILRRVLTLMALGCLALPAVQASESAEQLVVRGTAYVRLGNLTAAIASFQAATEQNPKSVAAFYNLGLALAQSGQPQPAIRAFYRSIQLKPDLAIAHSNLAAASLEIGDAKTAILYAKRATELSPQLAVAYYNWGLGLKTQGDNREAIALLQQAAALDNKFAPTFLHLGLLNQTVGNLEQAIAHYHQALNINPSYPEANYYLGAALVLKSPQDLAIAQMALTYFEKATQKTDYANAFYALGLVQARTGQTAAARQSLIKAQALFNIQKNVTWAKISGERLQELR